MGSCDTTWLIVRKASVWLCDAGKSEYTGYIRTITPLGFTAALSARVRPSDTVDSVQPSGQPFPDLAESLRGRSFVAAICGHDVSVLVEATASQITKLTGSSFDYSVSCRFSDLDHEQKKAIVNLIIEHYTPPSMATG
ncbi:MAG: hypothetical protein HYY18_09440 [Planctomycetes bacterium]|nr:hypothetical protein [Planctomycetota bacterium]